MKTIERRSNGHSTLTTSLLTVLFLILLGGVEQAQAQWTTNTSTATTTTTDQVGVGTTGPLTKLHVSSASTTSQSVIATTDSAGNSGSGLGLWSGWSGGTPNAPTLIWTSGRDLRFGTVTNLASGAEFSEAMRITNGGYVGIGTQAPNFNLDVNRGAASSDVVLGIDANGSSAYGPMLYFRNTGTAISKIMSSTDLLFQNTNNGSLLYLKTNGNVGIGQTNPTYKLDVNGSANVAGNITASGTITGGNIQATYQDVAEWVPSTHALAAGTVVTLNPTKSNEVMASTSAYDTRVAGVVSERPGLSLGEAGKDKALVATTGRVKVMVNADKAPIHVGDLLVSSDEEGVAMKSEPVDVGGVKLHRPGTLIGKALEPLESGKGQILVLLSLQ